MSGTYGGSARPGRYDARLGRKSRSPRETVTRDADGRFAIPGLFDIHVHLDRWLHSVGADHKAFLASGKSEKWLQGVQSMYRRLCWKRPFVWPT